MLKFYPFLNRSRNNNSMPKFNKYVLLNEIEYLNKKCNHPKNIVEEFACDQLEDILYYFKNKNNEEINNNELFKEKYRDIDFFTKINDNLTELIQPNDQQDYENVRNTIYDIIDFKQKYEKN